ncbi:MAG: prepilin-type N-terminal cleavage/methylation domain-containing protein [Candidatus Omnitrophica bacterium]|nr:prepilin-type N-terminal cleavage/methylation domain-containing protein [Candidatus Omnitrophota bacterium]
MRADDRAFTPLLTKINRKLVTGFTLLELLIATAILGVIMTTLAFSFNTGIFGYRNIEESLNTTQTALKVLERINLDLRNSFAYSDNEAKFTGTKSEMSFLTLVDTLRGDTKAQDYAFVLYKTDDTGQLLRLCRLNQESLSDKSQALPVILSSNVKEIVFQYGYLDIQKKALEWKDAWDDPALAPVAVKISLTIKQKAEKKQEAGQAFKRAVFLPLS